MKLYRNWIINEVARAVTKGEHTNERTYMYVRTYSHTYVRDRPYIPSTTLLCEGIIKKMFGNECHLCKEGPLHKICLKILLLFILYLRVLIITSVLKVHVPLISLPFFFSVFFPSAFQLTCSQKAFNVE